jgi:hypothetical protein
MNLIEVIQDHRWWVLAVCLPLLAIYGRVLVRAAFGTGAPATKPLTAPVRRVPPRPPSTVKPAPTPPEGRQEVLPSSIDAGLSGHQKAGAAKTVKLPAVPPKPTDAPGNRVASAKPSTDLPRDDGEAEAMDGLFGKRDEPPAETATHAIRRKASRLQELGFHHSIASDQVPSAPPAPGVNQDLAAPAAPAPMFTTPGSPAAPRSSTAELTSILERIDKFLAEDTPSKPSPTVAAAPASPPSVATTTMMKIVDDRPQVLEAAPAVTAPAAVAKPDADADAPAAKNAAETPPAAPAAPAKPDPNKKTQPMWARPDAMDEDVDKGKDGGNGKSGEEQQRLF